MVSFNLIEKWFGKSSNIKFYMNYNHDKQVKLSYSDLKWFINEHLNKSYVQKSLKKLGFVNTNKKEIFILYQNED